MLTLKDIIYIEHLLECVLPILSVDLLILNIYAVMSWLAIFEEEVLIVLFFTSSITVKSGKHSFAHVCVCAAKYFLNQVRKLSAGGHWDDYKSLHYGVKPI